MKTISLFVAGTFIAASVMGCKDKSTPEAPPTATATASVAAVSAPSGSAGMRRGPGLDRRGHPGMRRAGSGLSGMLFRAAQDLELREGQKVAIEDIQKSMHGAEDAGPPTNEFKEMHTLLAAGIRAGKLDTEKLTAMQAELDKAMQARRERESSALQRLHAALDPTQRKALVASVRAKQAERDAKFGEHRADAGPPKGEPGKNRRLEKLTKELDLDADQQKKVEALTAKPAPKAPPAGEAGREPMKKRMDAMLTAFESDVFDAKKIEEGAPARKMAEGMTEHLQFLNGLLPILKPEQREKMASNMERSSPRRPGRWDPADPGYGVLMFDDEPEDEPRLGPMHGPRLDPKLEPKPEPKP